MSRIVELGDPPIRVETVGQAAAGGLLLSIAIVELALGFWAAGWHHRAVGLLVAAVGLAVLMSGVVQIAAAVGRNSPRVTYPTGPQVSREAHRPRPW